MPTKEAIIKACNTHVNKQIETIETALLLAREAGNNDTKSSAGDKFETTRAMMHFEQEKLSNQLTESIKLREAIFQAERTAPAKHVALGSLVKTNLGVYFIAAGLGKIKVDDALVFVISTASPIGQKLNGKTVGEVISFNNVSQTILSII